MKHLFLIIISSLCLSSCGDDTRAAFDIDIDTFLVVPAGLNNIESWVFEINNIPTFIDVISPGATPDNISSVKANRGHLTGRFNNIDFRIIERISIVASSTVDPDLEAEVFYMDFIPLDHDGDLQMFSSLPEVKEILLQDEINLKVKLNFKSFVPSNIESRIILNFKAFIE